MIAGIHQCGDLSSNSIREYCSNLNITSLAIVGCCYNCLTERIDQNNVSIKESFQKFQEILGKDSHGRCLDESLIELSDLNNYGFPLSKIVWNKM